MLGRLRSPARAGGVGEPFAWRKRGRRVPRNYHRPVSSTVEWGRAGAEGAPARGTFRSSKIGGVWWGG